jgi:type VI secretion system protein ImpB
MANLSGKPGEASRPLKERTFIPVDRENFNKVLRMAAPRLALRVPNRLTGEDGMLAAELRFRHLEDFEPENVAAQVGPLRDLLAMRQRLTQLLAKLDGNDRLEHLLNTLLADTGKATALNRLLGNDPDPQAN